MKKIIVGFLFGLLLVSSPGFTFGLILSLLIMLVMHLTIKSEGERKFLTCLFICGIVLRIFLLISSHSILITQDKWETHMGDRVTSLSGDAGYYTIRSWWIAQFLSERPLSARTEFLYNFGALFCEYGFSVYLYLMALFYCLFGYSPISVTFINCILSVSSGIIYYSLAREISDIKSAKIASILIVFFPSLVMWSIMNLKDTLCIFFTGTILWSCVKLLKTYKFSYLVFLIFSVLLLSFIRENLMRLFVGALVSVWLCYLIGWAFLKIKYGSLRIISLITSSTLIITCIIKFGPLLKDYIIKLKTQIISFHIGFVSTGGFIYRLYDDWVYLPHADYGRISYFKLFLVSLKGWLHYFLEPFPWKIYSKLSLVALPQMLIWYFLLPFSILGMLIQLRYNWRKSLMLIMYFFLTASILSLTGGNIGTDFRIRDVFTPTIILFSAIGLSSMFSGGEYNSS